MNLKKILKKEIYLKDKLQVLKLKPIENNILIQRYSNSLEEIKLEISLLQN